MHYYESELVVSIGRSNSVKTLGPKSTRYEITVHRNNCRGFSIVRGFPNGKVVLSKMATAVRNVRSLMNISRFMIQSTACKASAVSVVHSRRISSLNRCPNFTNQLRPVRTLSNGG